MFWLTEHSRSDWAERVYPGSFGSALDCVSPIGDRVHLQMTHRRVRDLDDHRFIRTIWLIHFRYLISFYVYIWLDENSFGFGKISTKRDFCEFVRLKKRNMIKWMVYFQVPYVYDNRYKIFPFIENTIYWRITTSISRKLCVPLTSSDSAYPAIRGTR